METCYYDSVLRNLSGPVTIKLTNDYLFRAILQRNNRVLISLISALLFISKEEILSADIQNPIELGRAIDDKEYFLDVKVLLNNCKIVNLEMQVIDQKNWVERSTSYLCRSFDNLNRGETYLSVKSALQIGLLNFTLFPEHPEFYASYRLLNTRFHYKYTGKLGINVLDLTQVDLATDRDKKHRLDYWARFFKAQTWEEIIMLAEKYDDIKEAAVTVYQVSREEDIRLRCEAREDYYKRQRDLELRLSQLKRLEASEAEMLEQISNYQAQISDYKSQASDYQAQISDYKSQASDYQAQISDYKSQASDYQAQISDYKSQASDYQTQISEQQAQISEQQAQISEQQAQISEQQAQISDLQARLADLERYLKK